MRKGDWVVLASQAELAAGIVLAQMRPQSFSIDQIFLATAVAYIPTALVGGVLVAQEKGYHFLVGFFLGLFSIPGLILLVLTPPYRPPMAHEEEHDDHFLKSSPEGARSQ